MARCGGGVSSGPLTSMSSAVGTLGTLGNPLACDGADFEGEDDS